MFVDTHAHLWWPGVSRPTEVGLHPGFADDLDQVIESARAAGVMKMIVPGTSVETSRQAVELAKKYPGVIYAAVGIHPEEVNTSSGNSKFQIPISKQTLPAGRQVQNLKELINQNKKYVVAVGEVGTDSYTQELREKIIEQKELLKAQCEIALEYDLPVIIHTRQSLTEALQVLDGLPRMPRGQFHCFSHDESGLEEVLKRDFFVSFCGNVSWSKRVRGLVTKVPDDRLLLETDSPLMTPRNQRGEWVGGKQRNEPGNVTILAQLQAELLGVTIAELGRQTTENAVRLFDL